MTSASVEASSPHGPLACCVNPMPAPGTSENSKDCRQWQGNNTAMACCQTRGGVWAPHPQHGIR